VIASYRPSLSPAQVFVRAAFPLSCAAALLFVWGWIHHRTLVALVAALLTTAPLLFSARTRVVFVVVGGLFIFQSSDQLSPPKLYFLMGTAVCVAGALRRYGRMAHDPARSDIGPLLAVSRAFGLLILVSLFVAMAYGTPQKAWLRDAAPYLLFAVAPLIAYDAKTAWSQRALRRLLVVAGLVGTAAFAAQWLSNRKIVETSDVFVLPTFLLGAALFAYAMAIVLEGERQRLRWLVLASGILAGLIATGTRSSLLLVATPLAIIVGARRHFARRSIRFAIVIPAVALLVLLGVQALISFTGADREAFASRIQLLRHTASSSDQSFADRLAQTHAAWDAFEAAPLLGVGPGHLFKWVGPAGNEVSATVVDSPVEYLAKFGLLGLWPLLVLAWAVGRTLRLLRVRAGERTVGQLAIVGLAGAFVSWWALGVPFNDKGFASGFLLLLALALSEASMLERASRSPRA
jgi:O-antigen ligase